MKYWLVLFLSVLCISCLPSNGKKIELNGLSFHLPKGFIWKEPQRKNLTQLAYVNSDNGALMLFIADEEIPIEEAMQSAKESIYTMTKEQSIQNISDFKKTNLGGCEAMCNSFCSKIGNEMMNGNVYIVNHHKHTYTILTAWNTLGHKDILQLLNSMSFIEPTEQKPPLEVRMNNYVTFMQDRLPKEVDEYSFWFGLESNNEYVTYKYCLRGEKAQFTKRDLAELRDIMRKYSMEDLLPSQGSLMDDWISANKSFKIAYYDLDEKELFSTIISSSDITEFKHKKEKERRPGLEKRILQK